MTEAEWQSCDSPLPMLIFLRGDVRPEQESTLGRKIVSSHGDLFEGPGQRVDADQCRQFILRCASRLYELSMDELSREALDAYRRHALNGTSLDEFSQACYRVQDVVSSGGKSLVSHMASVMWTADPVGAAWAANDVAWKIANETAEASVAVTCAGASEDDWFAWSFGGGPPDPLWQATLRREERFQSTALREIVGNPFRQRGPAEQHEE